MKGKLAGDTIRPEQQEENTIPNYMTPPAESGHVLPQTNSGPCNTHRVGCVYFGGYHRAHTFGETIEAAAHIGRLHRQPDPRSLHAVQCAQTVCGIELYNVQC